MLLKYLSYFWRSLEILLINCKVELRLKWTKYSVLSAADADNVNNIDSNNIIFTIKDTNLYVPVVALSERENQKLSRFETSVYWNERETKSGIKIRQMNLDLFPNQILLESIDSLF